jgi:recombination protein RecT
VTRLEDLAPAIAVALPQHLDAERMSRVFQTCLRTTPKLNECTVQSFLGSVLQLAQMGLDPSAGLQQAYLIPRKIKGVMQCTTIIGYQGMLDIAYRSGKVAQVTAEVVREGDDFGYQLGLNPDLVHRPKSDDGLLLYTYAVAELVNGRKSFVVLTAGQIAKRRHSSAAGSSGPWSTHEDQMWKKSAIRELFKYLPKSAELSQVSYFDEAQERDVKQTAYLTPEVESELAYAGIDLNADDLAEYEDAS